MKLSYKIIIIFIISSIVLIITSLWVQSFHQNNLEQQFSEVTSTDRRNLWENILEREEQKLLGKDWYLNENEALIKGLYEENNALYVNEILKIKDKAFNVLNLSYLALFDSNLKRVYSNVNRLNGTLSIPVSELQKVLQNKQTVSGLGYDYSGTLLHSVAFPVIFEGNVIGVGAYYKKIDYALHELRQLTGDGSFIINRYKRFIAGEHSDVWEIFRNNFSIDGSVRNYKIDEKAYNVILLPVNDMFGNLKTYLISMKDITVEQAKRDSTNRTVYIVYFLVILVTIIIVSSVSRIALSPLQKGREMLINLAENKNILSLGNEFNNDDIGQILNSIERLRIQTVNMVRVRRSRGKQRQRVYKLLSSQLSDLAKNLKGDQKQEVVVELNELEQQIISKKTQVKSQETLDHDADSGGTELLIIAKTVEKISFFLQKEHKQLLQAIVELEIALEKEVAYLALQEELKLAHDVQNSFVPNVNFFRPTLKVAGYMKPAKNVGGDFYDYFEIDKDIVGFCVGDVSDKGVPSALFMMMARTLLWTIATNGDELSAKETLFRMNNAICANNKNQFFITLFYGKINIKTGVIQYASAGHPPAIVMNSDGCHEVEIFHDLVIGMIEDIEYCQKEIHLQEGDNLFVYSDGYNEANNIKGDMLGVQTMLDTLQDLHKYDPEEVIEKINTVLEDFTKDAEQSDDITSIVLNYGAQKQNS